ncbi:T9SS type A sorting domain-containing protein [Mesonia sp. HuA40]|uniref:T9SS type A sorting domain-containing protein n=1 Tax=Mesonia sp. HuA40 TaxID=2602761 RepID=UPI0011CB3763|nr:T9SS type A sorting domain-containing protein [Mesonia sp. HuA40]TXK74603.1 T9SS type A sorting domain-containing protein [Mesonia sp. HuA40]
MMKKQLLFIFFLINFVGIAQTASPTSIEMCDDDNDGITLFNLTVVDANVLNGQSFTDYSVSYFETLADAQSNSNPLNPSYTNVVAYFQTIYSRVEEMATGNFATSTVDLIIYDTPVANPAPDLIFCDMGGGSASFDLTLNSSVVLGTQNPSMHSVSFYISQADADAGTNEIANPQVFTNTNNPQTIYVTVKNNVGGCFATTSFNLIVLDCATNIDNDLVATADEDVNGNGNLNDDDTDGDGLRNYEDDDDDGDGVLTADEDYNNNGDPTDDDTDNSGTPDYLESNVALAVANIKENNFTVYPNPATSNLQVKSLNSVEVEGLKMWNVLGEEIELKSSSLHGNYSLEVSHLTSGTYFLQIQSQGQTTIKKIIIN